MSKKISAVLFDLDGVLVETRKLHYLALAKALGDLGFELDFDEHQKVYDGLPTFRKIEMLTERFQLSHDQIQFLNKRKQEYTVELLQGQILPNVNHKQIFSHLRDNNIKIAICSNTKRNTLNFILNELQIENYLEFSLSNEDVQSPKPSPDIYLKAMEMLNVKADNVLVFEDSPHGLESARKAKVNVSEVSNMDELTLDLVKKLVS